MSGLDRVAILFTISLRSLSSHRVKSLIVGGIMFFGTFLVVFGGALLDSVEASMQRSLTSSLTGHLQVYDKQAKDPLAIFGGGGAPGQADIGEIEDFGAVRAALEPLDNVAAVVPEGITIATVFGGNDIDLVLSDLRTAVESDDSARISDNVERVRQITAAIAKDYEIGAQIARDPEKVQRDTATLAEVNQDTFWAPFGPVADGEDLVARRDARRAALDHLDTQVAPLSADGRLLFLRVIGTSPERFKRSFTSFYIVDGEDIPAGKRGLLISKRTYEKLLKVKVARELDDLHEARLAGRTIAGESTLTEKAARIGRQYQPILFQMAPSDVPAVDAELQKLLPDVPGAFADRVKALLTVDDSNFDARYDFFYRVIAPKIRLHALPLGGTVTLRAFTKSGYARAINVKFYGTYEFSGLESSDLASAGNLVDLVTFRELYGKMSAEQQDELKEIQASAGLGTVSREDAEAALFGGGAAVETTASTTTFDEFAEFEVRDRTERTAAMLDATYTEAQMEDGLALNAAIVLKDPSRLRETQGVVERTIAEKGLRLQVVDWQTAAGIVGQLVVVLRAVLWIAIFVIFLVALVIINNAMLMSTLERTAEIGTIRAIGGQRGFVVWMFLVETLVLGLIAGGLGALAGAGLIGVLGQVGLPAGSDTLKLLFAGPRLYPTVSVANMLFGLVTIVVVSVLSTLYPAAAAARVPPVVAMQGKE